MSLRIAFAAFTLVMALSVAVWADGTHQVTIVKAGSGQVTLVDEGGNQHTIAVASDARITLDGKSCKLDDIRANSPATVTGARINDQKTITSIDARSSK